jgi:GDP-mannose 4,6 dehydratase
MMRGAPNARNSLITGMTGQDGRNLAELLPKTGCGARGLVRRSSHFNAQRIGHPHADPHNAETRLYPPSTDLTANLSLVRHLQRGRPVEVFEHHSSGSSKRRATVLADRHLRLCCAPKGGSDQESAPSETSRGRPNHCRAATHGRENSSFAAVISAW